MEQTRIQMFEQQIYPELFAEAAEEILGRFGERKKGMTEEWKKILQGYMGQIAAMQEEGAAPRIQEMDFSFLYTSMESGHPEFRIDSYGEEGRMPRGSVLTGRIPADWIGEWSEALADRLAKRARQENLQGYIRTAEIDRLRLRAVRGMLLCLAMRFKYVIQDMVDFRTLARIRKEPCFLIQIGEYMDWQKTIYAIQPAVDIFNCERSTDLRFRSFHAVHYIDKQFKDLNVSQSDFKDCVFRDSSIEGCIMNDCMFDGCVFENARVQSTMMKGCIFVNCAFRQSVFAETVFYREAEDDGSMEYFEPAEFHGCGFEQLRMEGCSADRCPVRNCDACGMELDGSSVAGSGFEGLEDKEEQDGIL